MSTPAVSVVICTRNRGAYLGETLRTYEHVRCAIPWELVVVNNGSTDTTADVLSQFVSGTTLPIRVVLEPRAGLCRARNAGWRSARGTIIAFTDDDCYPDPGFVDSVHGVFASRQLGFLGGRVLLHDRDDYPITIQTRADPLEIPPRTFIESGLIHGANLAARRDVIEALGGFDEMLGAGTRLPSGDDVDFINRASAAGYVGAYDPAPVVSHHHRRRTAEQVRALMRSYDIGRGAYYMKALMDSRRRRQTSRQWYWRTVIPSVRSPRAALKLVYEARGAFKYFLLRAGNRLGLGR